MPDDDPFKDDPPGPPIPAEEPTKKGVRLKPRVEKNVRTTATQWQSTAKPVEAIVEGPQLTPIPSAEEPRRLRPVEEKAEGQSRLAGGERGCEAQPLAGSGERTTFEPRGADGQLERRATGASAEPRPRCGGIRYGRIRYESMSNRLIPRRNGGSISSRGGKLTSRRANPRFTGVCGRDS